MKPDMFETPITVLTGLGTPTIVRTVTHAYEFLMDWPSSPNDPARSLALKPCRAALAGEIEPDTARGVFAAFAAKHDLIAHDIDTVVAGRNRRSSDPHPL